MCFFFLFFCPGNTKTLRLLSFFSWLLRDVLVLPRVRSQQPCWTTEVQKRKVSSLWWWSEGVGVQAGRSLEVRGLWLQERRGQNGMQEVLRRRPQGASWALPSTICQRLWLRRSKLQRQSAAWRREHGRRCSDEDHGREKEAADGAPGDRAGDAGASSGEQRPSSPQLLALKRCEAEQTRTALRAIRPLRTQLKKHSAFVEGIAGEAVGVGRARDCVERQSSAGVAAAREGAR